MARIIWLCMQRSNLSILKLGAIPPPILATIALMEESHKGVDRTENGEEPTSESVDIEQIVRDQKNCRRRSNTKEQKRSIPDSIGTDYGVYFGT
jgi:hypothetical protein